MVKITDRSLRDMGSKPLSGKIVLTVILLLAGPGPDSEYGRLAVTVTVTPKSTVTLHRITAGSGPGARSELWPTCYFQASLGNNMSAGTCGQAARTRGAP